MATYDSPRPSSQPVGSTDPAVVKDDLITLDKITTSTDTTVTNRKGGARTTLKGLEVLAQDAFRLGAGVPQGNYTGGVSVYEESNWTFTYNGQQWGLSGDFDLSTLPYLTTEADPNNDSNLAVRGDASQEYVDTQVTGVDARIYDGDRQILGGNIHPPQSDEFAQTGDLLSEVKFLRINTGSKIVMYESNFVISGTIDSIGAISDSCVVTVDGTAYTFLSMEVYNLHPGGVLELKNKTFSNEAVEVVNNNFFITTLQLGRTEYDFNPATFRRGFKFKGAGKDIGNLKGTRCRFTLTANQDAITHSSSGFPNGTIDIEEMTIENASFTEPTNATEAQAILDANNRGFWGVNSVGSTTWEPTATWQNAKLGGSDCRMFNLKNVLFEKFAFSLDVHTWMSRFKGVETRYCGTTRVYGTSLKMTSFWPQYCLYSAIQSGMQYSNIDASSLGEQEVTGVSAHGLQNYRGDISLYDTGWEGVLGTIYDCYDGRILVHNEKFVTDKTTKAGVWAWVRSSTAEVKFYGVNKTFDTDGDVTDPTYNWFRSDDPFWFRNITFVDPIYENNLPVRFPHTTKQTSWTAGSYRGLFANIENKPAGRLYFIPANKESRENRLPCMDIAYHESLLIKGDNSEISLQCNVFGDLQTDATASQQKTGTLRLRITPEAALRPSDNTVIYYSEIGVSEYIFTWSNNGIRFRSGEQKVGTGFDVAGDLATTPINAFFAGSVNNDGFRITLNIRPIRAADAADAEWMANVKYRVDIDYFGSCNDNALAASGLRFNAILV